MTQRIQTDIIDYAIAVFSAIMSRDDKSIIYALNRFDADHTITNKDKLNLLERHEIRSRAENLPSHLIIYYEKIVDDLVDAIETSERAVENHKGNKDND